MSGLTGVALGALLLAVFLGVLGVMVWRNARERRIPAAPVYVIEDAAGFVAALLDGETALGRADIRRILEWEVYFLQMQARRSHRLGGGDIVAGGTDQAVEYIQVQAAAKQQVAYSEDHIRAVLAGEAAYLKSIGAVGEVVT
jgi:hypothetical protein